MSAAWQWHMQSWSGGNRIDTSGDAYTFAYTSNGPHVCSIVAAKARGSNQHRAVERGSCGECGRRWSRTVDWRTRALGRWTPDA